METEIEPLVPFRCPECAKVPENYYGHLGRDSQPQTCPNTPHIVNGVAVDPVRLVKVDTEVATDHYLPKGYHA